MTRPLPPSPDGYRRFLRAWTGGVDATCRFVVVPDSTEAPHKTDANEISVGATWLMRWGIPESALVSMELEEDHA